MSDWRSGESNQRKPKKPAPTVNFPEVSSKPSGGWKAKGKPVKDTASARTPASRTWHGGAEEAAPITSSAFRKWLMLFSLMLSFVFLTVFFITNAFFKAPKLPLFVLSVENYTSSELLKNPYAESQRKKFVKANSGNIEAHKALNNSGDDNALSALATGEWLNNFKSDSFAGKTMKPGGPDKSVVAFYINAYASFTPQNDLQLYSQLSSPFAIDGIQGLKLEDLLRNIATKVANGRFAWIILDLQLPPGITNLDNLDPPWETAGNQALEKLEKLEPSLTQRLLVTLPGKDGQQNWLAPEFQGSFFGYYVLQLLEGRASKSTILDTELTVEEFQKHLDTEVSNSVNNRRFAEQNPVWLPATTVNKVGKTGLVTITTQQALTSEAPAIADDQLRSIDELWKKVNAGEYQAGYRWDPLGYAKVESQLLALEDIAIHSPNSFGSAKKLVDDAWNAMEKPDVEFGVSLIEDNQRKQYFHRSQPSKDIEETAQKLVANLKDSREALPAFLKPSGATEAPGTTPPPPPEALLIWQFYAEASRGEHSAVWDIVFAPDSLRNALSYVKDAESKWLEIYLLQRITSDIDWNLKGITDRVEGCAKALQCFQRIQKLATAPEPELSWWVKSDLEPIEKLFLRSFDQLLANQASSAIQGFNRVSEQLEVLQPKANAFVSTIDRTNHALHAIPHLLAWLAAEYQVVQTEEKREVEARLTKLGRLTGLVSTVYQTLKSKPQGSLKEIDDSFFNTGAELEQAIGRQMSAFESYLNDKTASNSTGAASDNAQTFRRERIVLHTPFLSLSEREKLHRNTSAFLKSKVTDIQEQKSGQKSSPERSGKDAVALFLEQVAENRDKWEAIVRTDLRRSAMKPFIEGTEPTNVDRTSIRATLLEREFWQRAYAPSFGAYPTLHGELVNATQANPWPWHCPWQRWSLAESNHRLWQVARLSEASWGNGRLDQSSSKNVYFYQLSEKYRVENKFGESPVGRFTKYLQSQVNSVRDEKFKRLSSLKLKIGDQLPRSVGTIPINFSCDGEWNAVAQIFLGDIQKRIPWQLDKRSECTVAADLSSSEKRYDQPLDADRWAGSPPNGTMAIRGNLISAPVRWVTGENKQIELTMTKTNDEDASIQILPPKVKPSIKVLLLIDCSNSMEIEVSPLKEGNANGQKVKLFELVKQNATQLIEQFRALHGKEANVSLGLIPFGLRKADLGPLNSTLEMKKGDYYITKEIKPLDLPWESELSQIVDNLKPSGGTPLYNAIILACEKAKSNEKTLIYVLSDGVNHINEDAPVEAPKSISDIRNSIKDNKNLRLSIFHYDFFNTWIASGDKERQDRSEEWRRENENGKRELDSLKSDLSKEQYGYYNSNEAAKLRQDSLDTIPRALVTIESNSPERREFKPAAVPIGREITIDRSHLPSDFKIKVQEQNQEVNYVVELLGGEHLKLEYDVLRRRLSFEPFPKSGWEELSAVPRGGNLGSKIYLRTLREQLASSGQLGFELNFCNENDDRFTRRPRFLVAELSKTNQPQESTFVLADHRFMPQTSFPIVQLSEVPWPESGPLATLRVWSSDTLPSNDYLRIEKLEQGGPGKIQLGIANVEFSHIGDQLIANVEYSVPAKAKDRVIVICPDFESSRRIFFQNGSEKHVFTLPENLKNKPSRLQFTTIENLEKAVQTKQVTLFNFDAIDLKR